MVPKKAISPGRLHLRASFSARCCWRSTSPRKRLQQFEATLRKAKPLPCLYGAATPRNSAHREASRKYFADYKKICGHAKARTGGSA